MSCRLLSNQPVFVYEEKKSKITFKNVDRIESESINVDGCEIQGDTLRCDFMHIAKGVEYYIELKGKDVKHAVRQIEQTIALLSANRAKGLKKSYVVCTRVPLTSTEVQGLKLKLKKLYNSSLEIKSSSQTVAY